MVLYQYDGIFSSDEEYLVYTVGERRVILIDSDVIFDLFECEIRLIRGNGSCPFTRLCTP